MSEIIITPKHTLLKRLKLANETENVGRGELRNMPNFFFGK
jgi:hypothetical protein